MTGQEVQELRTALGMSLGQFSQLLGVHYVTALRWEQAGQAQLRLDPLYLSFLMRIRQGLERRKQQEQQEWAESILRGLLLGGTLAGLAVLLSELLPEKKPRPKLRRPKRRLEARSK